VTRDKRKKSVNSVANGGQFAKSEKSGDDECQEKFGRTRTFTLIRQEDKYRLFSSLSKAHI
jgi:hypothetical protein